MQITIFLSSFNILCFFKSIDWTVGYLNIRFFKPLLQWNLLRGMIILSEKVIKFEQFFFLIFNIFTLFIWNVC